jgi:hypothetical protein
LRYILPVLLALGVAAAAYGAAATLSVNGGTIQAGSDNNVTCTTEANVDGWGLETDDGLVSYVRFNLSPGHTCSGSEFFVIITQNGTPVRDGKVVLTSAQSTGNITLTTLGSSNTTPNKILASAITDVHVYIDGVGGTANDPAP